MKLIVPKIEPLNEFWNTYYDDLYFMWHIDFYNQEYKAEIKHYNLN